MDNKRGEDKNFAEECREETLALQRCMEEHRDYYRDFILEADQESQALASEPEAAASPDSNDSPGALPIPRELDCGLCRCMFECTDPEGHESLHRKSMV